MSHQLLGDLLQHVLENRLRVRAGSAAQVALARICERLSVPLEAQVTSAEARIARSRQESLARHAAVWEGVSQRERQRSETVARGVRVRTGNRPWIERHEYSMPSVRVYRVPAGR